MVLDQDILCTYRFSSDVIFEDFAVVWLSAKLILENYDYQNWLYALQLITR